MYLVLSGIITGVIGTLLMDLFNHFLSRIGAITKIDFGMIGRISAGWMRMRFLYRHPDEIQHVLHEKIYGAISHYCIGIVFAVIFVFGWDLLIGGPASPLWALIYGINTTAGSWFFIYPSMGLGLLGLNSPSGIKNTISSLANHTFFGAGMAVSVAFL